MVQHKMDLPLIFKGSQVNIRSYIGVDQHNCLLAVTLYLSETLWNHRAWQN